jgi:hypothetical protein
LNNLLQGGEYLSLGHLLRRYLKKDCKNAASAWSRDGKIFVKRASDEKIFKIVSMSDFLQNDLLNFAY